ncbi:MAG: leucyl aminopeptidase, partial [Actinomycetota bacterium]|nr:leucyl aminopeptidase [Actinomycetota bacterium]
MIELVAGGPLEEESGEALAVPVLAGREWGPGAPWAVERLGDWLPGHLDLQDFSGQVGQVVAVPTDRVPFRTLLLVGVGSQAGPEELRRAAGWLGRRTHQFVEVATTLHLLQVEGSARAVAEGFLLGQYRFDKYRSQPKPSKTRRLHLLGDPPEEMMKEAQQGRIIAEAVALARDLINEPAAAKPPEVLAGRAEEIGRRLGLRVKVYDEEAIEAEGFGGLRGVAAGAENPARLVELWYEPDEPQAFLALVGKGIVFDSGGLSIKSASAMEPMKTDMSGAAVVYGAVQAIAGLGLPVKVLGITPLTENMPGGGAQRPGDVLRARNGKTIEVLNTDAEGRLVLADGLALAAEAEPDLIVDVATLTGSCRTALGDKIAGLWSNDQEAAEQVKAAADRAGERVWPMPLPEDYRKNLDSEVADMKNTGGRYGGAINASLLLQEFVDGRPWVHLDIAGPARWGDNEHYQSKGGSGFGVRTLVSLA